MRRVLRRPSPSMLVALLALFVALGGTSMAAIVITGKNVKNGSLSGTDIKDGSLRSADVAALKGSDLAANAVSGKQIDESTLGQVPSALRALSAAAADRAGSATSAGFASRAATAASAASATNATNAAKAASADALAGGVHLTKVRFVRNGPVPETTVFDRDGFRLTAACSAGGFVTLYARTTVDNGELTSIEQRATDLPSATGAYDDDFDTTDSVQLVHTSTDADDVIELRWSGDNGKQATGELVTDDSLPTGACVLTGFVTSG